MGPIIPTLPNSDAPASIFFLKILLLQKFGLALFTPKTFNFRFGNFFCLRFEKLGITPHVQMTGKIHNCPSTQMFFPNYFFVQIISWLSCLNFPLKLQLNYKNRPHDLSTISARFAWPKGISQFF